MVKVVEQHTRDTFHELSSHEFVILSEAKDLLFAANRRSFASLRMTIQTYVPNLRGATLVTRNNRSLDISVAVQHVA